LNRSLRIVAVGDLSFNGAYARVLQRQGTDFPFRHVAQPWRGADLLLGNLESPLTTAPKVVPAKLTLRAAPQAAEALRDAGFDAVALANNHAMDYGARGLEQTRANLAAAGIPAVGAAENADRAAAPLILHRQGQSIGLLAFCHVEQRSALYAGPDSPGVAAFEIEDAVRRVRELRAQVDWVIVQLHWGQELAALPLPQQRVWARALVESGADLILGHHPHILQPLELIGGVPVFYSLGNFLFSEMFWRAHYPEGGGFLAKYRLHPLSRLTGWAEVTLTRKGPADAQFVPARLAKDHRVVPDPSGKRAWRWDRLCQRLHARDYEHESAEEVRRARERLRWQADWRSWYRRLEARLFGYGLLPSAAEGD
jgi:hypothetical protein